MDEQKWQRIQQESDAEFQRMLEGYRQRWLNFQKTKEKINHIESFEALTHRFTRDTHRTQGRGKYKATPHPR